MTLEEKTPAAQEEKAPERALEVEKVSSPLEEKSAVLGFKAPLEVLLNGEALVLPAKEDGQPYYMMDLLEHSDIDFEHVDRPIRLAVNGEESGFRQVIKTGDTVEICYEDADGE